MKQIVHNDNNLKEKEINNIVRRAKMLVENDKEELLLVYSHKNYFLIGGHVDDNESFDECIVREIEEETGVTLSLEKRDPFMTITYYNKDYPEVGINSKYIANYYSIKYDLIPKLNKQNLTDDEKDGNFTLKYIHKDKVIDELYSSLDKSTRKNVVLDTIDVIKEYLK